MSRIKEKADRLIVRELVARGIEGIVPSHGEILVRLFDGQENTMKDLAENIHRTKPTVTILVDKLVGHGYVIKEKSVADNRVTFIKLTDKGRALEPAFREISAKLNELVYSAMTAQEAAAFERALVAINRGLDAGQPKK